MQKSTCAHLKLTGKYALGQNNQSQERKIFIKVMLKGIARFFAKFIESGSVARNPGSGRPSKATTAVRTWARATRGNLMTQRKYETELTVQRNGTERRTERNTVERNGTDRFTPFLEKRSCRATQTERTVFRPIFLRIPCIYTTRLRARRILAAPSLAKPDCYACSNSLDNCS